jgi:glycosyltransferase involved in cell wall biosynthesis
MINQPIIVSIVIPLYNHGQYIQETLDSIDHNKINYSFEIIIVDDGSTDLETLQKIDSLKKLNYNIIQQKNGGPGKARNAGVSLAVGKYILPLDADNKINPEYINKAIPFLESNQYDIVYASPIFFGDTSIKKRQYKVRPFNDLGIVTGNCADACAIYRKDVWTQNNGYDEAMPYFGFEDWDFWINASKNGFRFHFIKEKLFYYRILNNSMVSGFNNNKRFVEIHRYIAKKHSDFFLEKMVKLAYTRERYYYDLLRFPITPIIYLLYWLGILEKSTLRAKKKYAHYEVDKKNNSPSTLIMGNERNNKI